MSKYTTQLRWIVEQRLNELKLTYEEGNWVQVYEFIGLHDYPIFDELYREELNNKIIRSFYFREIGFETLAQFRWQIRKRLFEIMPYYNQLYSSENLITDPLLSKNLDYTEQWTRDETTDRTNTSDTTAKGESTSDDKNIFQDTPMNGLDTGAIENGDYATTVTLDKTNTDTTTTSNTEGKNKYTGDYEGTKIHNQKGYDNSQAELLMAYRRTFLNIDLEIIKDLDTCFMQVW